MASVRKVWVVVLSIGSFLVVATQNNMGPQQEGNLPYVTIFEHYFYGLLIWQ